MESFQNEQNHLYSLMNSIILENQQNNSQGDKLEFYNEERNEQDTSKVEEQNLFQSHSSSFSNQSQEQASFDESSSSSQESLQSYEKDQTLNRQFLDELILQIDQFQELYYLSLRQNIQTQTLITNTSSFDMSIKKVIKISRKKPKQYNEVMSKSIFNPSKKQNKQHLFSKDKVKKNKKIPQIYHPQLVDIKKMFLQLKTLHLFSILKNKFIIENYQPRKFTKTSFIEQVNKLLKSSSSKSSSKNNKNKQNETQDMVFSPRKISIKRIQQKSFQKLSQNYFDLTNDYSEQEFQLIQVQEINFNQNQNCALKNKYESSLSTTIDFDLIQEQNHQ